MADAYYKTIGEAWSAMVAAFTAADVLIYNASGFSISWTPSSVSTGGYWTVEGTTYVGEPPANGTYRAADAKTGAGLPLAYVLKSQGMADIAQVTSASTSGALTAITLRDQLEAARTAAVEDITGATRVNHQDSDLTVAAGPVPCVLATWSTYTTGNDAMIDVFVAIDQRGQPNGSPVTYPPMPMYQASAPAQVVNNIDVGPQLDTDVAINNGSVIDTVVAKQFTGI